MALDVWYGQFNTVGGTVLEDGPYIGVFEGDAGAPGAIAVYVLAEPCGGAAVELCEAAINAIARGFGQADQPLTACLLRAFNAAHAYVAGQRPADADPDFGVGVTVLATREEEAYVAQAGPSLACVRAGGQAKLLEPLGEESLRPLGAGPRVTPSFARYRLAAGDTAVLCFSSGAYLIDRRRLPSIAAEAPEYALPDLYLRVRGELDFAALYLAILGEKRGAAASAPPTGRAAGIGARRGTATMADPVPTGVETLAQDPPDVPRMSRNGHAKELTDTVRTVTPRRTPLGSMAASGLPITRRQLMVGAGVAGAGLLLALAMPSLARQGKSEKFAQLLRATDEAVGEAEREPDLARRRSLLEQAQSMLDEARALRSVPPEDLAALDGRLRDQLAAINGVRELSDLSPIADLAAPTIIAPSATQIVAGPALYILDANAGKVMAVQKEGELRPFTLFEEGRPVGRERTGRARHVSWWAAERGRPGSLLVLDDQRRLYGADARGDIRPIALGDASEWKADTALAMGTSHLYVLDAGASQIWRYALNADGFPGAPEPLLGARAAARDASGLSLAGTPIVTTPDGRLLRVVDGREQPLQPVAMDRPLLAPAPPILNGIDGLLYIADRGNQRIVRLSPDGTFRGQLVSHRLAGLQAIALDEDAGALYAIAGQALVKANIPR